jgi:predicted secreted protein
LQLISGFKLRVLIKGLYESITTLLESTTFEDVKLDFVSLGTDHHPGCKHHKGNVFHQSSEESKSRHYFCASLNKVFRANNQYEYERGYGDQTLQ